MRASAFALLLLLALPGALFADDDPYAYPYPSRVRVLPVFFVPQDQDDPTPSQRRALIRHLRWAQARFERLLDGASTFELARKSAEVYRAHYPLAVYRSLKDDAAQYVSELLAAYGVNRFTCPYVFVVILVNPCEDTPAGGGRPCNGGFNRGSGVLIMSSYGLERATPFQSTLRHELGHSFGLPHVDVYGDSMGRSRSIMSYNVLHHTAGFRPSEHPGGLIPEDVRALAANDRVFANLEFDPKTDAKSYRLRRAVALGPMEIPDEARFVASGPRRGAGLTLRRGKRVVRHEPSWSRGEACAHLRALRRREPRLVVAATHEGQAVKLAEGYELFYGSRRVGHSPSWPLDRALTNLRWNLRTKPNVLIVARFNGRRLLWSPHTGYELFHDGARVGQELTWTRAQGLTNLRSNRQSHPTKAVEARYNGVRLVLK
jgi:hypothetical protein